MSASSSRPADAQSDPAQRKSDIATYGTLLALDRTTLAWIRTTLTLGSFGFGMAAFFRSMEEQSPGSTSVRLHRDAFHMGAALMVLGIVAIVFACMNHWTALQSIRRGETPALRAWPLSLTIALASAILGLAGLWELFAR